MNDVIGQLYGRFLVYEDEAVVGLLGRLWIIYPLPEYMIQRKKGVFKMGTPSVRVRSPYPNEYFDSFEDEAARWGEIPWGRVHWRRFKKWVRGLFHGV